MWRQWRGSSDIGEVDILRGSGDSGELAIIEGSGDSEGEVAIQNNVIGICCYIIRTQDMLYNYNKRSQELNLNGLCDYRNYIV